MNNVIIVCLASMLAYISKEMIFPIMPLYLTGSLGLAPAFVSLIEGITKALASIVKFYSGYYSDKKKQRKKFIMIGFTGLLLNKLLLITFHSWPWIVMAKLFERFGKAIKLAPQDAILIENSPTNKKGVIIGLQRTFDKLGAALGIIIAYLLITKKVTNYQMIFVLAALPLLVGLFLLFFIKQEPERKLTQIDFKKFSRNIQLFFMIAFISALGNSTESILILKAHSSGFSSASVILLYLLATLTAGLLAYPIGKLCDKVSKKYIIASAHSIFGLAYFALAITNQTLIIIIAFILYGLFEALISVGAKAYIIENTPSEMKATALGINECLIGLASLPAAVIAGGLWHYFGPNMAFYASTFIAFVSALFIILALNKAERTY